jgi:hypothetical protein
MTALILCRIQNTPNAETRPGTIIALRSLFHPSLVTRIYIGIMPNCPGIIMVRRIKAKNCFWPLNFNFAKA